MLFLCVGLGLLNIVRCFNENRSFGIVVYRKMKHGKDSGRAWALPKQVTKTCFLTEVNGGAFNACGTIVVCEHDNSALIDNCVSSMGNLEL